MKLDSNYRYDIKAETFRIMTGHMAPGKDPPMASYPAPFEERSRAFDAWYAQNKQCVESMLLAFERIVEVPGGD